MTQTDDPRVEAAIALIRNGEGDVLLLWNAKWGGFTWPMTKIRLGEEPCAAAERAGAEALGVPVRAGEGRRLEGNLHVGGRDNTIKLYVYHAYPVAAHPRFAAQARPTGVHIWLSVADIQSGVATPKSRDIRPLSDTCYELIGAMVTAGVL